MPIIIYRLLSGLSSLPEPVLQGLRSNNLGIWTTSTNRICLTPIPSIPTLTRLLMKMSRPSLLMKRIVMARMWLESTAMLILWGIWSQSLTMPGSWATPRKDLFSLDLLQSVPAPYQSQLWLHPLAPSLAAVELLVLLVLQALSLAIQLSLDLLPFVLLSLLQASPLVIPTKEPLAPSLPTPTALHPGLPGQPGTNRLPPPQHLPLLAMRALLAKSLLPWHPRSSRWSQLPPPPLPMMEIWLPES